MGFRGGCQWPRGRSEGEGGVAAEERKPGQVGGGEEAWSRGRGVRKPGQWGGGRKPGQGVRGWRKHALLADARSTLLGSASALTLL